MQRIQIALLIFGLTHQRPFIRLLFFSAIVEPLMDTDTWTVILPILSDGSTQKEMFTMLNITIKLLKALKTLQQNKLLLKVKKIQNGAQTIFITKLQRVISQHGTGSFKPCPKKMQKSIDSMFSTLQRFGLTPIIPWFQLERSLLTETQLTITLRLSKVHSLPRT